MNSNFAQTPQPPYYAVIFSNQRTVADNGYNLMSEKMVELALRQPGCLGAESTRGADGFGITVSYWESEESIQAWKADPEHLIAQKLGKDTWYSHYELRVARVERAYAGPTGR